MWNLTYFYAARPADGVDLALQVFAEKLAGVTFTQELLDAERQKVLAEIEGTRADPPAVRKFLEQEVRYPKAGIESHVRALVVADLEAYLATQYRPDRCTLLVRGAIDVAALRPRIEKLFGACRARPPRPLPNGVVADVPEQVTVTHDCASASERERAALRMAAAAWETQLRRHGRAYVEITPDAVRAVLVGGDLDPVRATRERLHQPLADAELRSARAKAGQKVKMLQFAAAQYGDPAKISDVKMATRILLQSSIDRLRLEAEGSQALSGVLDSLSADEVAAVAGKFLTADTEQAQHLEPVER